MPEPRWGRPGRGSSAVPRYVKFVEAFPMTVTGKIQKYVVRERMAEELGVEEAKTA